MFPAGRVAICPLRTLDRSGLTPYSEYMCSRYELNSTPRELAQQFKLSATPSLPNQAEVRPTDQGLIINPDYSADLKAWGFPAPWDGKPVFNARAETLTQKPTFRPHLGNRCIVPASAFPEWQKNGKERIRYRISLGETATMAFAGLYDDTHYTVITCAAAPQMAEVHSRMPVILPPGAVTLWLDSAVLTEDAISVLSPYEGDDLLVEKDSKEAPTRQGDLFS